MASIILKRALFAHPPLVEALIDVFHIMLSYILGVLDSKFWSHMISQFTSTPRVFTVDGFDHTQAGNIPPFFLKSKLGFCLKF